MQIKLPVAEQHIRGMYSENFPTLKQVKNRRKQAVKYQCISYHQQREMSIYFNNSQ
ncbi:hypothetical protein CAAN4_G09406 [[Candida] anglica]|uniref:Uncharacterized protein n=1 Tax=[Candida] anglica TaxID=148631 RepID=A0ABP0EI00_9ASCO